MDKYAQEQGMAKRTPHHYSEWVVPLISSLCLVTGTLWAVSFFMTPKSGEVSLSASSTALTTVHAKPNSATSVTPAIVAQPNQRADDQSLIARLSRSVIHTVSGANPAVNARSTLTNPLSSSDWSESKPVPVGYRKISGETMYVTQIDLTDPHIFLGIGLAHNASQANNSKSSKGDEDFAHMVRRHKAAVTVNGTFFSMDQQKRVMGNMVSGGRFLKYSPWENYGTTLGMRSGNRLEMVTARTEGKPNWQSHWFSITAGPRLLKDGKVQLQPRAEGFTDRHMMEGKALRIGMGYPKDGRSLLMVTFLSPLTLVKQARIMHHLGCDEAMNLDGGTSVAMAQGGKILQPAGRELTNVITVYDVQHPAPDALRDSWRAFQRGNIVAQKPVDHSTGQMAQTKPINAAEQRN
jgi:Phosphodiester glycosidase